MSPWQKQDLFISGKALLKVYEQKRNILPVVDSTYCDKLSWTEANVDGYCLKAMAILEIS